MKSFIELVLLVGLLWIASWYGSHHALMPWIWWIIALVLVLLLVTDVITNFKKSKKS